MEDVVDAAWRGEEELLSAPVRRDPDRLRNLLDPDFYEIGQSGRRWDRDAIIAALLSDADEPTTTPVLTDREARRVGHDEVLLSYRLEFGSRVSRRSSLWRADEGSVRCVFHQGTPVPAG